MSTEEGKEVKVTYKDRDINDYYETEEEISKYFNGVQNTWYKFDNGELNEGYDECIQILKKVEHSIINHGIFSPNESLKEIATENLK